MILKRKQQQTKKESVNLKQQEYCLMLRKASWLFGQTSRSLEESFCWEYQTTTTELTAILSLVQTVLSEHSNVLFSGREKANHNCSESYCSMLKILTESVQNARGFVSHVNEATDP